MTRSAPRPTTPRRTRFAWLGAAAALAFAIGLALELVRAPDPPPAERPAPSPAAPRAVVPPAAAPEAEPEPLAPPEPPARRVAIRARLEEGLAEHFPDRKLASDELDAAADALLRLRAARLELKELPRTRENAERIEALVREIGEASSDFEYFTDVDPITFTERVSGEVDEDEDEEAP